MYLFASVLYGRLLASVLWRFVILGLVRGEVRIVVAAPTNVLGHDVPFIEKILDEPLLISIMTLAADTFTNVCWKAAVKLSLPLSLLFPTSGVDCVHAEGVIHGRPQGCPSRI
ncbi:hypothetical protein LOH53_08675 [Arthrobacter cryoconiti]|nr:hypothetical protein [Arthrobacter cryoconiti]